MRKIYTSLFLIIFALNIFGVDFSLRIDENINSIKPYQGFTFKVTHTFKGFNFLAELNAYNDDKYNLSGLENAFYEGYYFYMKNGGVSIDFDNYKLRFGRLQHYDIVDSPYSLYISSKGLSSVIIDFNYEDESFFYETRYIELNRQSQLGYKDRGANFKTYGLKIGNFRFAYEESAVYVNTAFDIEYFLNVIPNFFVQYVNISSGKPWYHGYNANSIMGFMLDYKDEGHYYYAQILVDDINANRILNPDAYQNPDKVAWSVGGKINMKYGAFGLYNAGATKYTFQPSGDGTNRYYGYTYYPNVDINDKTIPNEENYIGYYNGENNIAFMTTYENNIKNTNIRGSFEYVISGSKSPANPWGEYATWTEGGQGTHFLDDEILEHKYDFNLKVDYTFYGLKIFNGMNLRYTKNKLELVDTAASDNYDMKMFKPSNKDEFYYNFNIGVEYRF
ncbi:hypothetical protein SAMN02745164_00144 [Marinitoga hydrogenitolerans DSM 16785]|uniref:Uncharacterized protein n=1 Tax=Marinitoga hydrogenitolerans (strain DSM 16785 / JCM 12826 / AT1271) TaxID=1122195 RepID=A0A1M4S9J1_MARH1|nr:hypothetical protein [Marinitoga hydrogenitolerans]SHE28859.1 hypothetical protein SAMN02745164_00144 [Marinitoga hydrogenitolerans DSM 16785]